MDKIAIGILAHVDAGKTTLSEGLLYLAGTTRRMGRVDKKDTFLDNDSMERARGITVFSKEARFNSGNFEFTLVDTPGHADFSTEMERVLAVLDYAILVISGTEGVQSHTITLIRLLELYSVPCFIFVNKMDMAGASFENNLREIKRYFPNAVDMSSEIDRIRNGALSEEAAEEIASCSETLMNEYFSEGTITIESLREAVRSRMVVPVTSGSALKMDGVSELLGLIGSLASPVEYPSEFGAKVYKITRDSKGNRLTHLKVTGGILRNKMLLDTSAIAMVHDDTENNIGSSRNENTDRNSGGNAFSGYTGDALNNKCHDTDSKNDVKAADKASEKVEQIRLYNGEKFTTTAEVSAGTVCAVLGPVNTYSGQGLGYESGLHNREPLIEPSLIYTLILPDSEDPVPALQKLMELEEEDPTLRVTWEERTGEIKVSVMGELEKDLLKYRIKDRFGMDVSFGQGKVIYKETITSSVDGIGHYEPLRHYAEVRLLLEPLPEGSGLVFESRVSEDELKGNWQRLILKHLRERRHKGTLLGSEITDMKISLIAGRAHLKHTEGGDFRQATYRAVRQGLRKALSQGNIRILEPMYDFTIRIPQKHIGHVMTDLERLGAVYKLDEQIAGTDLTIIRGRGPVSTLGEYQMELNSFSEGTGRIDCVPGGYGPCHDQDEVVELTGYDCDNDVYNPCGSVFTDHGAGVYVSWNEVDDLAHTEGGLRGLREDLNVSGGVMIGSDPYFGLTNGSKGSDDKTLKEIFERTYGKSKRDEQLLKDARSRATRRAYMTEDHFPNPNPRALKGKGKSYLLIDGYNVLFAWDEFEGLRKENIDGARESLIDIVMNYQGFTGSGATIVFDGYRVKGNAGTSYKYGDLNVVYTKEAETADRYIEEFVYENGRKYDLTVVTSDRQVQMSAFGDGADRMSAREFHDTVVGASLEIRNKLDKYRTLRNRPFEEAFKEKGDQK